MIIDKKVNLTVSDGSSMDAYVAFPEGEGPFPAVMVFQEAYGVNNHMRNIVNRLAKEGYLAIAPELFHRTGSGLEFAYTDFASVAPHFHALTTDGLMNDVQATYDWLKMQKNVIADKIASIGFCMGGRVSFLANTMVPLAAAVSYYGGGISAILDRVKQIHAPQLFFWGGLDKHIPAEQIEAVKKAMNEAEKKYTSIVFPEGDHGFNCDERASYNPAAAKESWGIAMDFFSKNLK